MNLILLFDEDFVSTHEIHLKGRRFEHIKDILKANPGKELTVGKINGLIGQGKVLELGKNFVNIKVGNGRDRSVLGNGRDRSLLKQKPPAPLNLTLIMALPRPPMLKRTLQCASSLGVKKIIILNFAKVEKSLWQSSMLKPEAIEQELWLGLEQAKDTILPEVILKKRFKPFVEDELPALIKGKKAFVAHPGESASLPRAGRGQVILIIGPEGGLTDFEVNLLKSKGVQAVHLGTRILRFENVIPFCVGKMY